MLRWQLSPTQMKRTCNANDSTYITLCFLITIGSHSNATHFFTKCDGLLGYKPVLGVPNANRVFSTPVAWPVVTMETVGQTNPVRRDSMVWALSAHYIMLIRPQQALPLVRIYWKLFIFKYIFKMQDMPTSSCNIIRKKTKFHRISSKFKFFCRDFYLMNARYSKLAFLHRVKERKTPSLSAQANFARFSLKVA